MLQGKFISYKLISPDMPASRKFYTKIIGWTTEKKDDSSNYEILKNNDKEIGHIVTVSEKTKKVGFPIGWVAFIGVDDLEASAKKAANLGAKVLIPPSPLSDGDSWSLLQDPQGGILPITHINRDPEPRTPRVGEFYWRELLTHDHKGSWGFYHEMFGWKKIEDIDMNPGLFRMFSADPDSWGSDTFTWGGIFSNPKQPQNPPIWLHYICVHNLDAVLQQCQKMGGKTVDDIIETPDGGRMARCMDPQGITFAMYEEGKTTGS